MHKGIQGGAVDGCLVGLVGLAAFGLLGLCLCNCCHAALLGCYCLGLAALCVCFGLLLTLDGLGLLALSALCRQLQLQLAALRSSLGFSLALDGRFTFGLRLGFGFTLGTLRSFAGNAFLAVFLLTGGGFGAELGEFGLFRLQLFARSEGGGPDATLSLERIDPAPLPCPLTGAGS